MKNQRICSFSLENDDGQSADGHEHTASDTSNDVDVNICKKDVSETINPFTATAG